MSDLVRRLREVATIRVTSPVTTTVRYGITPDAVARALEGLRAAIPPTRDALLWKPLENAFLAALAAPVKYLDTNGMGEP